MKKVVVASLLAVAIVAPAARMAVAQTQVNLGSNEQAAGGGVQMSPAIPVYRFLRVSALDQWQGAAPRA